MIKDQTVFYNLLDNENDNILRIFNKLYIQILKLNYKLGNSSTSYKSYTKISLLRAFTKIKYDINNEKNEKERFLRILDIEKNSIYIDIIDLSKNRKFLCW